ncbi:MAG TPA: YkgJ family cysteine cluster protein, partial [Pyrinomonadaceae bacterium]|nr:YkgJ family cysteine cluster protein [Pyrinomonadaceae bacterium]
TNAFVDASVDAVESQGEAISCKAGCGACCRQPVPISEVEVYQIAELVRSMPEPRRGEIEKRFADGAAHFQKIGWFDEAKERAELTPTEPRDEAMRKLVDMAMRYFYQGIPCPFLENESCSIHESRPVACREYLVTSPAENCSKPTAETVRVIDIFLKPSLSLRRVGSTGQFDSLGFLPMIRALEIAEAFPEDLAEKTGREWMADFFNDVTAQQNAAQAAADQPNT